MPGLDVAKSVGASVCAGTLFSAIQAGGGALSGLLGTAILKSATGNEVYNSDEAVKMGAIGGAILGGAVGLFVPTLSKCGFFGARVPAPEAGVEPEAAKSSVLSSSLRLGLAAAIPVVDGLIGYGILNETGTTVMNLAETASVFAAASIPGAALVCCVACCVCCMGGAAYAVQANQREEYEAIGLN